MIRLPVERVTDLDPYKDVQEFIFLVRPELNVIEEIVKAIGYVYCAYSNIPLKVYATIFIAMN